MSYPQYPGGYNPYPAYPPGMPAPSGATAITAGVLACVGAVTELFGGGVSLVFGIIGARLGEYDTTGLFSEGWFQTWAIASGAIGLIAAVLLGVGAVAMFTRKSFGRVLIVVGCVAVIVVGITGTVLVHSVNTNSDSLSSLSGGIGGLFGLIFPVATAVLALLPMTGRWLAHTPVAAAPQPYGYPYPQPGAPRPMQPGAAGQLDGPPPAAWGQAGQVPAGQASWQQAPPVPPTAGSPPAQAWQQATTDGPDKRSAAPQPAWGVPAQPAPSASDQVSGIPPVPQAAWGVPAQPGLSVPNQLDGLPPVSQAAWGVPAQPGAAGPNDRGAWPPSEPQAWGAPAAIGRNDETVLRPPPSVPPSAPAVPPQPADDTVWRPPPA
ncbi:hypothetical protein ACFWF7_11750 [Nocardia sp. NPDC060256]|uniref:hypothetical protein n=1 Tax=unclassified Nocardia TaxID=2637762 RepID=UPI0036671775